MESKAPVELNDKNMFEFFEKIAHDKDCIFGKKGTLTRTHLSIAAFDVSKRYDNLCILHNGAEASEILLMVDNVLSIFDDYFPEIPGLNHLMASNYTDIEVAMFLEHKEDGAPGRQRDHFTHQFRNAYMGIKMLYDLNLIENVLTNLKKPDSFLNVNFDLEKFDNQNNQTKEALINELVYKTYFITALFHDIGYPLSYFMKTAKRIHDYTPFYKMVNSDIKTSFIDISAMLTNSLLFKLVKKVEIEEKYSKNDHGCLSAISFLTHFYNNGLIFSLEEMDKAIIEWAAFAIFNHTNKYNGTRMLFADDPVSYVHRICDDLQEWNRFSVIIQETSNYLRCPECNSIIQRVGDNEISKNFYQCSCKQAYEKITTIKSKKLNYIELCEEMIISGDNKNIDIRIDYNLYKQIQLMINDFSSIEYRKKDLDKLKKMLLFQGDFPCVKLQYFLGNDIEEIKKHLENNCIFIDKKLKSSDEYKSLLEKIVEIIKEIKYNKDDIYAKREYQDQQIECAKKLLPLFYDLDKKI